MSYTHRLGLALCFLTFPVKTVTVRDDSQEESEESEAVHEVHIEVEDKNRNSPDAQAEETVINEIVGYLNTTEKVGAESVFYCSEGCFVLNKNMCNHKHLGKLNQEILFST